MCAACVVSALEAPEVCQAAIATSHARMFQTQSGTSCMDSADGKAREKGPPAPGWMSSVKHAVPVDTAVPVRWLDGWDAV